VDYASYNTAKLSDVSDSYYYAVSCPSCLRNVRLSLERLRDVLGDQYPVASIVKRLRCRTCGSKHVTVSYLKPSQAVGNLWELFQREAV
jgi:phenylalanyl-tRNA synthetase beta subunit